MSANLDLVRSIYADWEQGEFTSADWADPEIAFAVIDGVTPTNATGRSGMAQGFRSFLSAWESLHVEADDYREIDDERVLVLTHLSGRGKTSGADLAHMQTNQANVFHIRDGKVARLVIYNFPENALADLGLEE